MARIHRIAVSILVLASLASSAVSLDTTVHKSVRGWIAFANPKGAAGKARDTAGGCARPISEDGCRGMDNHDLGAVR